MGSARRRSSLATLATLAVLLAACAQPGATPSGPSPTASPSRPPVTAPPAETIPEGTGEPVTGEVPRRILDPILADAAERLGVAEPALEVVRGESVTWNDGSLGCPEPGVVYPQVLVDGYHVVVEADGQRLDYRVDDRGAFRLCEQPGPPFGT